MKLNKEIFITVQPLISLTFLWFVGCAGNVPKDERDFSSQFEEAKSLFDKKKYIRSQEEFQLLVVKASHTDIGDDALFYLRARGITLKEAERMLLKGFLSEMIEPIKALTIASSINKKINTCKII